MQDFEQQIDSEQKESSAFIIGILIGLVSSVMIELLINSLEKYLDYYILWYATPIFPISIRWMVFILCVLILVYLIGLWKRVMGISNYIEYEAILTKNEAWEWNRLHTMFKDIVREKLRDNKIDAFTVRRFKKPFSYDKSYVITDMGFTIFAYLNFFENHENKKHDCRLSCIIATKYKGNIEKSILGTLKELTEKSIINESILTPINKVHITFWLSQQYKTPIIRELKQDEKIGHIAEQKSKSKLKFNPFEKKKSE